MANCINGETSKNIFAMNAQSVVSQFCNKVFAENQENQHLTENSEVFEAQNDEEIGTRLIRCLRQGRLSHFSVALIELRETFAKGKACTPEEYHLEEEALEILEDTLSLLELVDFAVENNKDSIPLPIIQNIGRLFRRLSMGLNYLVSCSERAMLQRQLEAERLDHQFVNMLKWIVNKAKVVSTRIIEAIGRSTLNTNLLNNLQQAILPSKKIGTLSTPEPTNSSSDSTLS